MTATRTRSSRAISAARSCPAWPVTPTPSSRRRSRCPPSASSSCAPTDAPISGVHPDAEAFVRGALAAPPARVLEVGAGSGDLARALIAAGYDVVAVDPRGDGPPVEPVALLELRAEPASFDAAVAVFAMHHVEPLAESCAWLAQLVRPGAALVLDELDVDCFDESVAAWWLAQRADPEEERTPADLVAYLHHHCHPLDLLLDTLGEWFELDEPVRGPY